MKKIFTLLVAAGMVTLVQAQPGAGKNHHDGYENGRGVISDRDFSGTDGRYNGIMSPAKQRDLAIARINREYDWKIQKVKDNFFKSRSQKKREIRFLNEQRKKEIKRTYYEFSKERRHKDYRNRRY